MRISCQFSVLVAVLLISAAAAAGEPPRSARIVTSSEDLQLSKGDHAVCLDRRLNPHATTVLLPADAQPDQEFVVDDCSGNSWTFPVTMVPPAGHSLHWRTLRADNGSLRVRYFGNQTWGAE